MPAAVYFRPFVRHLYDDCRLGRKGMRRLVLGFPIEQFEIPFPNVKAVTMLHLLKLTNDEYEAICRVEFRTTGNLDPWANSSTKTLVQVLSRERDGSAIVYLKGRPFDWLRQYLEPALASSGVHLHGLFELQDGKLKAAFIGGPRQIGSFLKRLDEMKVRRKIMLLGDARFSPDSPLYALTEKQRQILMSAFRLGYFEIPRRTNLAKLSHQLNIGRSTINEHLRKAESRLVSQLLAEGSRSD